MNSEAQDVDSKKLSLKNNLLLGLGCNGSELWVPSPSGDTLCSLQHQEAPPDISGCTASPGQDRGWLLVWKGGEKYSVNPFTRGAEHSTAPARPGEDHAVMLLKAVQVGGAPDASLASPTLLLKIPK